MISLSKFILESGPADNAQEKFTCLLFDYVLNLNGKIDSAEDVKQFVETHKDEINSVIDGNEVKELDKLLKDKKWISTFVNQVDAIKKFISDPKYSKLFSGNLIFVHDATGIGVQNGKNVGKFNIQKRVSTGASKFKVGAKDDYQKADMYILAQQDINVQPKDDIASELTYWIGALDDKKQENFIGISLKKLTRPITPHVYNKKPLDKRFDISDMYIKMSPYSGVKLDYDNGIFDGGKITSNLMFAIQYEGLDEPVEKDFQVRSASSSDGHMFKPKNSPIKTVVKFQLKSKNVTDACEGQCLTTITKWQKELGMKNIDKDGTDVSIKGTNNLFSIDNIRNNYNALVGLCDSKKTAAPDGLYDSEFDSLRIVYDNQKMFKDLFNKFSKMDVEKDGSVDIFREDPELLSDIQSTGFNSNYWSKVSKGGMKHVKQFLTDIKALYNLYTFVITNSYIMNIYNTLYIKAQELSKDKSMQEIFKKEKVKPKNQIRKSFEFILFGLVTTAKGINVDGEEAKHLPYLFIGNPGYKNESMLQSLSNYLNETL